MTDYRWNQSEMAAGYDAGAALVHPCYVEVQDAILERLPFAAKPRGIVVDLGGGSGRLVERILDRWPQVTVVLIDQSQAFLDLASARVARFGHRARLVCRRLQDDWPDAVPQPATAIVSMSAIHHLDPTEKQGCYRRCFHILEAGGVLLNGDEVRAEADADYRMQVESWAAQMEQLIADEAVTPAMADGLRKWRQRNVVEFGTARVSGDDCHETAAAQLRYLRNAGFVDVAADWSRALWTVLTAHKPT